MYRFRGWAVWRASVQMQKTLDGLASPVTAKLALVQRAQKSAGYQSQIRYPDGIPLPLVRAVVFARDHRGEYTPRYQPTDRSIDGSNRRTGNHRAEPYYGSHEAIVGELPGISRNALPLYCAYDVLRSLENPNGRPADRPADQPAGRPTDRTAVRSPAREIGEPPKWRSAR